MHDRGLLGSYGRANRSRFDPVKRIARTVKAHLESTLTTVVTGATNARTQDFNTLIQKIKRDARGFRNKQTLKTELHFHRGGLEIELDIVRQ